MTYVTGAHNMKFGYQGTFYADDEQYFTNDEKVAYRLNNGVPNLITQTLHSNLRKLRTRYHAVYAQEQWTLGRMTLQGARALRPRVELLRPSRWSGRRASCRRRSSSRKRPAWSATTTSRRALGLAYDVFGNGKTALKVNLGRYLDAASNNNGNYSITNPTSRMAGSTELGRPPITRVVDRCERELHSRLQSANPDAQDNLAAGGDFCGAISDSQLRHRDAEPQLRSGGARGLGRASGRLGVRRVRPAGSAAARLGRGRLLPPLARQLLRGRQPRHRAGRLHAVQHHRAGRRASAGRRRLHDRRTSTTSCRRSSDRSTTTSRTPRTSASGISTTTASC